MTAASDNESSSQGTWREWARHVLAELKANKQFSEALLLRFDAQREQNDARLDSARQELQREHVAFSANMVRELGEIRAEILLLKFKAGLWGAVGASIPIITSLMVGILVYYLTKGPA